MDGLIEQISKVNRPKLGDEVPVVIFRAFRLFTEMYLEETLGNKGTLALLQNAGGELGKAVAKNFEKGSIERLLDDIAYFVKNGKIGILLPEHLGDKELIVSLDECITCAGMPNVGKRVCYFEAGFIRGILEEFFGRRIRVSEIKCNAMGEGICQVKAEW